MLINQNPIWNFYLIQSFHTLIRLVITSYEYNVKDIEDITTTVNIFNGTLSISVNSIASHLADVNMFITRIPYHVLDYQNQIAGRVQYLVLGNLVS